MISIRDYLIRRSLIGASLILLGTSAFLGIMIRELDIREFDSTLETKARVLATLALRTGRVIEIDFAHEFMPAFELSAKAEYFQFRLPDGSVIERSDVLGEADLPFLPLNPKRPVFRNLRLPDGRAGRMVQIAFPPRQRNHGGDSPDAAGGGFSIPPTVAPESVNVVLTLARSLEPLHQMLRSIYIILAAANVATIVLIGAFAWRTIRRALLPLDEVNAQIAEFTPTTLARRIRIPEVPAELHAVQATLNRFIETLEAAFARERRFTSDVAHELRTPVAELRSACEVGARWPEDSELTRRLFDDVLEVAMHMEGLVSNLLELARCDGGRVAVVLAPVDLRGLTEACWGRCARDAEARGMRLDNRIPAALELTTDREKLDIVLRNLIGNAVDYGVEGTDIVCEGRVDGGTVRLSILNRTDELRPEDLPRLFDRFWRRNPARTSGRHAGLGLCIVKSLADAMGVAVRVGLKPGDLFEVSLAFPSVPHPPAAA